MKLHYYPETDSLYVDLNSRPSAASREIAEGLVIDFDAQGSIEGIPRSGTTLPRSST